MVGNIESEPSVPTSQSKAGDDAKRGGNGGQDGDEDLEDLAPDGCFVCFHGFEKVKGERVLRF